MSLITKHFDTNIKQIHWLQIDCKEHMPRLCNGLILYLHSCILALACNDNRNTNTFSILQSTRSLHNWASPNFMLIHIMEHMRSVVSEALNKEAGVVCIREWYKCALRYPNHSTMLWRTQVNWSCHPRPELCEWHTS